MANSPKKFSEEAEAAISVLRAIVTSKKGASTVQSVLADFRELEGGPLKYKQFGYPNADEFLKATGAFVVQSRMGESVVFAKHHAASAHIQKMVSAQRSTKTKKSGFATPRQPQKKTGPDWHSSAYNRMYPRVPYPAPKLFPTAHSTKPLYQGGRGYNNPPKNTYQGARNNNQPKPLMALKVAPPAIRNETNNNSVAAKNLNRVTQQQHGPLPNNDLRHRITEKTPLSQQRQLSSLELKNRTSPTHVINKDALQKSIHDAVAYNTSPARSVNDRLLKVNMDPAKPYEAPPVPASNGFGSPRTTRPPPQPMILTPPSTPVTAQLPTLPGKSLQDRLKKNQQVDSADLEKAAKVVTSQTTPPRVPDLMSQNSVPSHPVTPPANNSVATEPFSWNDPNATPVELLVQYANRNGFSRPIYKYLRLKTQRYQCRVTVNGSTYSTYPADFANEFECQFAAARIAIENIKRDENRNNYSVCLEPDYEIANKLYELLEKCPSGMFSKKIPDAFLQTHKSLLPDHWESEIMLSRPRMFYKEEVSHHASIYFAVVGENGSIESDNSITAEAKVMSVNMVELPWEEPYWNLYITNPVSTVEIWARLVGPAHSDRMDALATDIEMAMMDDNKKQRPKAVSAGEYYLLSIMDCWHRVRVDEVDHESNQALCFFIDLGDQEKVSVDEIYVCDPRFLELPAQSVCFTLDNLEDFGENPKARPHLDNLICGKVCIGHILTTKVEYQDQGQEEIKMMLYDTSSEEDLNLNEILLKKICDDTPVPELQRKGVTTVMITFVDDEGNVYCQLKDTAMTYIEKIIKNLVQSGALEELHRGLYKSPSEHQLFLVRDEEDHKYYRAVKESKDAGSSVSVLYVDYGIRKTVQSANLYQLQTLSVALSRYPAQAIRMKLFDLPEVNEYLLSRLRALLKPGLTAMVKVAAWSVLPLVKIYLHYGPSNILVCLNESIRAEMELEISSEIICEPRASANDTSSISSTASSLRAQFSSPVPSQVVPRLTKCPLPRVGDLFDVTVTIASSPNYFIVQPYRHAKDLNTLMVDLQSHCKGPAAQMVPPDNVEQGEVYAGFDSDDGNWYRVLVVNILCGPTLIHVYFCDFGQIKMLDSKLLRVLPQQLRNLLPQQAVKAKLYGVQPRHGDWSTEDAVRFQQLTEGKKFASYIRSIQADEFNPNDDIVELELIDVSTSEDIMVHQQLVDEGRAVLTNK